MAYTVACFFVHTVLVEYGNAAGQAHAVGLSDALYPVSSLVLSSLL